MPVPSPADQEDVLSRRLLGLLAVAALTALTAVPAPASEASRPVVAPAAAAVQDPPAPTVVLPVPRRPGEVAAARSVRASSLPAAEPATPADLRLDWGPSLADLRAAEAAVAAMSLEQLAGQVVVARWPGADPATAAELVRRWHLGGVILMGDNVVSAEQVRAVTSAVHGAVADDGRAWPAVVAVDEEGGRVSRLRGVLPGLPAFAAFGARGDDAATRARFATLGRDLRALGITTDLAPVADVTIGAADPTIGDRSASADPVTAARTVVAAAAGLLEGGAVPVLKHFPGHGSVTADSHHALPVQPATPEQLAARDLVPFQEAVDAGAPVVMTGHLELVHLEPGVPASLSPAAHALLRDGLGFDGVVVTDALDMAAVPSATPGSEAVAALAAGADLLLMPRDVGAAHAAIVAAVRDGVVPADRLREAAVRVVAMQLWAATLP